MFNHIRGTVTELTPSYAVIETCGIGFRVYSSLRTISELKLGENTMLYISEAVREDAFDLYGFARKDEKDCYEMLTSVSGIGPKAAMSVLSSCSPDALINAINSNNEHALTVVPGIGKKTAQRIILELKDKVSKADNTISVPINSIGSSSVEEAIMALNTLGYTASDINSVLRTADVSGMSSQEIIRLVLKYMVSRG